MSEVTGDSGSNNKRAPLNFFDKRFSDLGQPSDLGNNNDNLRDMESTMFQEGYGLPTGLPTDQPTAMPTEQQLVSQGRRGPDGPAEQTYVLADGKLYRGGQGGGDIYIQAENVQIFNVRGNVNPGILQAENFGQRACTTNQCSPRFNDGNRMPMSICGNVNYFDNYPVPDHSGQLFHHMRRGNGGFFPGGQQHVGSGIGLNIDTGNFRANLRLPIFDGGCFGTGRGRSFDSGQPVAVGATWNLDANPSNCRGGDGRTQVACVSGADNQDGKYMNSEQRKQMFRANFNKAKRVVHIRAGLDVS